jgi:hypothetical protein
MEDQGLLILCSRLAASIKDTNGKFDTGGKEWEQYLTADTLK